MPERTEFKHHNITVTVSSANRPSERAIKEAARVLADILEENERKMMAAG